MTGQGDHFLAHALLQATIADESVGEVVDQVLAKTCVQVSLCHGHTESVGNALTQRAGRHFNANGRIALRMPFTVRAQLTKSLNLFNRKVRVAREVQQGIQQHGAVPVGQHHAVAVPPGRLSRVELEVPRVKRSGNFSHAQGHALVPFLSANNRIDGQKSDGMSQGLLGMLTHSLGTTGFAGGCLSPVLGLCSLRLFRPDFMNTSEENSGFDEWHSIVVLDSGPHHQESWHEDAETGLVVEATAQGRASFRSHSTKFLTSGRAACRAG